MDNSKKAFGQRLSDRRDAAGLSQAEFARLMDVSRQTVIGWEKGSQRTSSRYLKRIDDVLFRAETARSQPNSKRQAEPVIRNLPASSAFVQGRAATVFAGNVLFKAGQIAQLALDIDAAVRQQLGLTSELGEMAQNQPPAAREIDPKIFGANVRSMRELRDLTPSAVAKRIGWPKGSDVEQLEAGKFKWSIDRLLIDKFATALNTTEQELCGDGFVDVRIAAVRAK